MLSGDWGWALELSARLEQIWPCWIPFLAGLSLFGVLRTWFVRQDRMNRIAWKRELERDFEHWQRRSRGNGTDGPGSSGA